jgi:phytoene dehydrogenase-like protein
MNGYDVEIHESHDKPGGLCTAWKRGEYIIDGCVEWLSGSRPDSNFYPVWEELGAVQDREMVYHDIWMSVIDRHGRVVRLYTDIDRLEEHLIEISPDDSGVAKDMCRTARRLGGLDMPVDKPAELANWWDRTRSLVRMAPTMLSLARVGNKTLADLGARFQDASIRTALTDGITKPSDPAATLYMVLGTVRGSGYPIGGSLPLARAIEKRLLDLGGKAHYRSRVAEVIERDGRAIGVRLEDGSEVRADCVISACDMEWTHRSLLGGRHMDPVHKRLLETEETYSPYVHVAFGVDMDFSDQITCVGTSLELDEPTDLAGRTRTHLLVRNQCHDPDMAPPGKSVVVAMMQSEWSYWERFENDRDAYKTEKDRIATFCREQIDKHRPGFADKVEMVDVATPLTFVRYTGNRQGAYMSWVLNAEFMRKYPMVPRRVPGLEDFYLSSMWTNPPGGLPGAAKAGREVVQLLCDADGRSFETSTP